MRQQIDAVMNFLKTAFPGCDIWDSRDPERSAHTVSVATDSGVLLLTASFELLSDHSAAEITTRLRNWNAVEALREAGRDRRLLITTEGMSCTTR